MATQILHTSEMFTVDITVRESDVYSGSAYVKIERNFGFGKVHGTNELYLTPTQLEALGYFLISQGKAIRLEQEIRGGVEG